MGTNVPISDIVVYTLEEMDKLHEQEQKSTRIKYIPISDGSGVREVIDALLLPGTDNRSMSDSLSDMSGLVIIIWASIRGRARECTLDDPDGGPSERVGETTGERTEEGD